MLATTLNMVGCESGVPALSASVTQPARIGSPELAESTVRDWLIDMAGRDAGLGWARLDATSQRELYANDPAAYRAEAMVVGEELHWLLLIGATTSDGDYHVGLTISAGASHVEDFAGGRLIRLLGTDGTVHRAAVTVRMQSATEGAVVSE